MSKDKKARQWHPLFAALLRPLLQNHFDVRTNYPVGDTPRHADILLLQRTSDAPTPFRGLWRHLTAWNIVEFKGPSVDARAHDLDLLVELGLGIDRRLNEEQHRQREPVVMPANVSFWYIARSLGRRFLRAARQQLGFLEEIAPGLWRSQVLRRLVFLVSSERFATEPDSVPLQMLLQRTPEQERELARLIVEQPHYQEWYGTVFGMLHPQTWREVNPMAATKRKGLHYDFSVLIEDIGLDKFVETVGIEKVMEAVGIKKAMEAVGVKKAMEAVGVKKAMEAVGVKKAMEAVGPEKIMQEMGVDWLLDKLTPAQLKKLKERLK